VKLLNVLLISCQRAADLVHKKHNIGLNRNEKLKLKVHTKMCTACKTFEKQTDQIEEALKSHVNQTPTTDLTDFKVDTLTKLKE
jgi:hypothetical protein